MALENLKSVFNDISKNTKEDFGGPHGQGVHGGLTNESPSTPPFPDENTLLDNTADGASIPPQIARVFPDNKSIDPTLETGKGSQVGDSIFLSATGNSRFTTTSKPGAPGTKLEGLSILDNRPDGGAIPPQVAGVGSGPANDIIRQIPSLNSKGRFVDTILGGDEFDPILSFAQRENHSELDNIAENLIERNLLRNNSPIKVLGIDNASQTVDYSPFVEDAVGPNIGLRTFDELSDEKISNRRVDISNLGRNAKLGKGDFTLGTLFKHNHRGSPQRTTIDTGVVDSSKTDGSTIQINTGRAGIGSLGNLDIKGYSTFGRTGLLGPVAEGLFRVATLGLAGTLADNIGDFGKEPYIVRNIPKTGFGSALQGVGDNRDFIPFRAALDDASRLAQFYTSPAGILFTSRENITNSTINIKKGGFFDVFNIDVTANPFDTVMAPPVPFVNTGFLNFLQQSVQGAGLGSIRKPFTIQYSDRFNVGVGGYKRLGDRIVGLKETLKAIKIGEDKFLEQSSETGAGDQNLFQKIKSGAQATAVKGLRGLRNAAVSLLENAPVEIPPLQKPTDFIDTSGFGDHNSATRGPVDVFGSKANQALLQDIESSENIIKPGDFYVRIKDLRNNQFIYFRGFVTGIVENVSPSWTSQNYIGRSEPVWMYERADRDLSFNLKVYPQNAVHQKSIYENLEILTSLAYPEYMSNGRDYNRMRPPFTELYMAHIGTKKQGQFGYIKSLSYTVPEEGDWDALNKLPRLFDIAISYQILSKGVPSRGDGSMSHTNTFYGAFEKS